MNSGVHAGGLILGVAVNCNLMDSIHSAVSVMNLAFLFLCSGTIANHCTPKPMNLRIDVLLIHRFIMHSLGVLEGTGLIPRGTIKPLPPTLGRGAYQSAGTGAAGGGGGGATGGGAGGAISGQTISASQTGRASAGLSW